ncbi:MAG: hypothetical protein E7425_12315 [Ruminococcaceae bacterium]|nr:hypothetical protein [Oscillospiraceae bacterium]
MLPKVLTAAQSDATPCLTTPAEKYAWNHKQDTLLIDGTPTAGSTNPVQSGGVATALNDKAPVSHASSAVTYGKGTDGKYGHVLLSDAVNSTSAAASGGVAATPKAVKTAYDLANGKPSLTSSVTPVADGTAAIGNSTEAARANHVHPTDTSRSAKSVTDKHFKTVAYNSSTSDLTFTTEDGSHSVVTLPTVESAAQYGATPSLCTPAEKYTWNHKQDTLLIDGTPTAGSTNPVQSGGVATALDGKAPLASPGLTGNPTAPTQAASVNNTRIATTAFVQREFFNSAAPAFSNSANYAVGEYVMYNGVLYRCTTAHSAAAWNADHFMAVTIGAEMKQKTGEFTRNTTNVSSTGLEYTVKQVGSVVYIRFSGAISAAVTGGSTSNFALGTISGVSKPSATAYATGFYGQSASVVEGVCRVAVSSGTEGTINVKSASTIASGKTIQFSIIYIC